MLPPYETDVSLGIILGPPDVCALGLPDEVAVRLHNELFNRGLITSKDIKGRAQEVFAAIQAAYRVDTAAVLSLYE